MDQPDPSDLPEPGTTRRAVLLGGAAAAAAAGVGVKARPAGAAPVAEASVAAPQALVGPGLVNAADVDLNPAGELTATNVQDALYDLDGRLSKMRPIDELRAIPSGPLGSMTLVDDFMGNTNATGTIGSLGWATGAGATGTVTPKQSVAAAPGVVELGTNGVANGWTNVNLGTQALFGCPAFVQEIRVKLDTLNTVGESIWVFAGLMGTNRDAVTFEPKLGCYFRYGPTSPNWIAVCAVGGGRTERDTGVPADNTAWHRFRATSAGPAPATPGIRFKMDDLPELPVVTTHLLSPWVGIAPTIEIRKSVGSATQTLGVDYYAMQWAVTR
jgi:hypothetical protein